MIAVIPMRAPFFSRHRDLALSAGSVVAVVERAGDENAGAAEVTVDAVLVS